MSFAYTLFAYLCEEESTFHLCAQTPTEEGKSIIFFNYII